MTQFTPPSSSRPGPGQVPEPRTAGDPGEPRTAVLRALADRPAPLAPPGAVAALTDRFLVHTSWGAARAVLPLLPQLGGVVLRGAEAATGVGQLHHAGFSGVLAIDPEGYAEAAATAEQPFVLPTGGLFDVSLPEYLQGQRDLGATVTLTPTGYLWAGDSEALRAATSLAADLDRDDVLFSAPLDIGWFTDDHIDHLIAVLAQLSMPKAVFLGGQFDPLERYKASVRNLRRLVGEAGHVAVLRTDLTGFDAVCHGAFAASIGTGGSLRHIIPFGQRRQAANRDQSPSVLHGDLMTFFKGTTLAKRFANHPAPTCNCPACGGRALDSFHGTDDSADAHAHGIYTWNLWVALIQEQPTLAARASWWQRRAAEAITHCDELNSQLGQDGAFTPPATLKAWAELPPWPTGASTPQRSRTH